MEYVELLIKRETGAGGAEMRSNLSILLSKFVKCDFILQKKKKKKKKKLAHQ
jgi:hypothetical protein